MLCGLPAATARRVLGGHPDPTGADYGLVPNYLADDSCLVTDSRPKRLHSTDTLSATEPLVQLDLRQPGQSHSLFRQSLTTYLEMLVLRHRVPLRFQPLSTYTRSFATRKARLPW